MPKSPAPVECHSANYDALVNDTAVTVNRGNNWETVVKYHILMIFRLFGDRFCKFCDIADVIDAATFIGEPAGKTADTGATDEK